MLSLLVVVFFIQLVCHLVLTIGSKPINDLVRGNTLRPPIFLWYPDARTTDTNLHTQLWQIYCRLPLRSSRDIQEQIRLRREVVRLKREMNAVSAQDEFSKWAKIRRQHDKAMAEHDKKGAFCFCQSSCAQAHGSFVLVQKAHIPTLRTLTWTSLY